MTSPRDPLAELSAAGVAIWLDDISRQRLVSGNLAALNGTVELDPFVRLNRADCAALVADADDVVRFLGV